MLTQILISRQASDELKREFRVQEINSSNKIIIFSEESFDGKLNDNNSDTLFNKSGSDPKYKGYWFQRGYSINDFFKYFDAPDHNKTGTNIIKILKKGEKEEEKTKFQELWISLNMLRDFKQPSKLDIPNISIPRKPNEF